MSVRGLGAMLVTLTHAEDLEPFCDFLGRDQVHAVADQYGFVSLSLLEPKSPVLDFRELENYITVWNALYPARKVKIL
jgi:hypothetical protein